jgi:adenosylcobinamide kinase/adenosylcobinamide-phosphate guanylyltransferase
MSLVIITGGTRSGKSSAAQQMVSAHANPRQDVVVATFARTSDDPELADRVARHQADRPDGFITIEAADSMEWLDRVADEAVLLVDCAGTLLGRVMEELWPLGDSSLGEADADLLPGGYPDLVASRFESIMSAVRSRKGDTVIVTNEVGAGVVPLWASARLFCDVLGRTNRELTHDADRAYLVVCGRLMDLSALPQEAQWPSEEGQQ